jgi:hypothetical protein
MPTKSLSPQWGEPTMANALSEILLYSWTAAFVTRIVIAAASLISQANAALLVAAYGRAPAIPVRRRAHLVGNSIFCFTAHDGEATTAQLTEWLRPELAGRRPPLWQRRNNLTALRSIGARRVRRDHRVRKNPSKMRCRKANKTRHFGCRFTTYDTLALPNWEG